MTATVNIKSLQSMLSVTRKTLKTLEADLAKGLDAIAKGDAQAAKHKLPDEAAAALEKAKTNTIPNIKELISRANAKIDELTAKIAANKPAKQAAALTKYTVAFYSALTPEQLVKKLEKLGATGVMITDSYEIPTIPAIPTAGAEAVQNAEVAAAAEDEKTEGAA